MCPDLETCDVPITRARALNKVEEVKKVYVVYGVYDLVVRVEAETLGKLKTVISDSIRTLENVRSTVTMIVMD